MVFPSSRHPLLHSHCRSPSSTSPPPFFHIHRSLTHPFLSRSRRTGEPNKPSLARYGAPRSLLFDFFAFPRYAGCGKYRVSISVSGVWCIARFSPGSGSTPPTLPVWWIVVARLWPFLFKNGSLGVLELSIASIAFFLVCTFRNDHRWLIFRVKECGCHFSSQILAIWIHVAKLFLRVDLLYWSLPSSEFAFISLLYRCRAFLLLTLVVKICFPR